MSIGLAPLTLLQHAASFIKGAWTTIATLISAGWLLWLFIVKREAEPSAELDFDLKFVGSQDAKWLVEVLARLCNKGSVRLWYDDFEVVVRYLLPDDKVLDGTEKIFYQLECKRTINERIGNVPRKFSNASYIDPKLTFQHSYITFLPENATFVWVQLRMRFHRWDIYRPWKRDLQKKNIQRLFKVPPAQQKN